MGVAIVAIPAQDDYVWTISSEKVPHLTLLFLGDQLKNASKVEEFIEHVAKTSLRKFSLKVDRRGVLGDDSADVLFFDKRYGIKGLEEARQHLLGNTDIFQAYNSTEQFPEWTPHLTLGYPESPAKSDKREYPGLSWITFDRIALWTGNYEGGGFTLKSESALDVAMSAEKGEAFLEHFGIKGMKWGITRSTPGAVGAAGKQLVKTAYKPSGDAIKAQKFMARAKLGGVRNLDNREMHLVINRMALEKQYKELHGERQWHYAGKKWAANFVTDVLKNAATSWLSNPFARGKKSDGPVRAQAWTNGQDFARAVDGSVTRKAIRR